MNVEALNEVKRVLRSVPEDAFNLGVWWDIPPVAVEEFHPQQKRKEIEKPCGSAACAIGWAATDNWFKSRGLIIQAQKTHSGFTFVTPVFDDKIAFDAVAAFFDIDESVAMWMFDPDEYWTSDGGLYPVNEPITTNQVMRRIDMVLTGDPGVGDPCA